VSPAGPVFAYVSGSSLFLIVGLRPAQYGLILAATSLGIIMGPHVSTIG
jgi:hypothetical protein